MAEIRVQNLTKTWGSVRAVDGIGFATGSRAFVSLLGPSGCGKSTTLRLIAGLEQASAGSIAIDGRDVTSVPAAKRNLSMVFQCSMRCSRRSIRRNTPLASICSRR